MHAALHFGCKYQDPGLQVLSFDIACRQVFFFLFILFLLWHENAYGYTSNPTEWVINLFELIQKVQLIKNVMLKTSTKLISWPLFRSLKLHLSEYDYIRVARVWKMAAIIHKSVFNKIFMLHSGAIDRSTWWLQVVLILPVGGSVNNSLSVFIFMKTTYIEDLETYIFSKLDVMVALWALGAESKVLL